MLARLLVLIVSCAAISADLIVGPAFDGNYTKASPGAVSYDAEPDKGPTRTLTNGELLQAGRLPAYPRQLESVLQSRSRQRHGTCILVQSVWVDLIS